jgi:hypothetical protein
MESFVSVCRKLNRPVCTSLDQGPIAFNADDRMSA